MRPHEFLETRVVLKMTQVELAAALEIEGTDPARTIRRYESGRSPIPGPVAVAVRLMMKARK